MRNIKEESHANMRNLSEFKETKQQDKKKSSDRVHTIYIYM